MKLRIILGSTRPNRNGLPVAEWFVEKAKLDERYDVKFLDLAELKLPLMDEPNHPRNKNYINQHTKDWSKAIGEADCFVLVTPEYNHSAPSPLTNAIDYLHHEWANKPVGFVSYGGVSGGLRAVEALKTRITTLNMMPISEGVVIPFITNVVKDGKFNPNEVQESAVKVMLDDHFKWSAALKEIRK